VLARTSTAICRGAVLLRSVLRADLDSQFRSRLAASGLAVTRDLSSFGRRSARVAAPPKSMWR